MDCAEQGSAGAAGSADGIEGSATRPTMEFGTRGQEILRQWRRDGAWLPRIGNTTTPDMQVYQHKLEAAARQRFRAAE